MQLILLNSGVNNIPVDVVTLYQQVSRIWLSSKTTSIGMFVALLKNPDGLNIVIEGEKKSVDAFAIIEKLVLEEDAKTSWPMKIVL